MRSTSLHAPHALTGFAPPRPDDAEGSNDDELDDEELDEEERELDEMLDDELDDEELNEERLDEDESGMMFTLQKRVGD